jgi:hypothetical protein
MRFCILKMRDLGWYEFPNGRWGGGLVGGWGAPRPYEIL